MSEHDEEAEQLEQSTAERRHPAEVTADRLEDQRTRYHDRLTPREQDAIALVWNALDEIARGRR